MSARPSIFALAFLLIPAISSAYQEVHVEKTIPLVAKKNEPSVLRREPGSGNLWILNKNRGVLQQIGEDGKVLRQLAPGKKTTDIFKSAADFDFAADGSLVIADAGKKAVVFVSLKEKPVKISDFPLSGVPTAVAISSDHVVAVAMKGEKVITAFSQDGIALHFLQPDEKQSLEEINALAYGRDGTLWALDHEAGVLHRFSSERKWIGAAGGFDGGTGLAVDAYGFGYVTLSKGKWVEISPEGKPTGMFGTKGKKPGEMMEPVGVATNGRYVWVAEAGNNRIQIFNVINDAKVSPLLPQPAAYLQISRDGTWTNVLADAALFEMDGRVLLIRSDKNEIEWKSPEGKTLSTYKKKGKDTAGFLKPHSAARGPKGEIWISDESDHSLKQFGDGITRRIGEKGRKEGSLRGPQKLQVRKDGSFIVTDRGGSRIQAISRDGVFLFTVGSSGKGKGQFRTATSLATNGDMLAVADDERKSLLFHDANGRFVSEVSNQEGKAPYWISLADVATDPSGRFLALDSVAGRIRAFNAKGRFLGDASVNGKYLAVGPNNQIALLNAKHIDFYRVHFVPRAVAKVSAEDDAGDLRVQWEKEGEAAAYRLYRSTDSTNFELVTETIELTHLDTKVIPGRTYVYAVAGLSTNGTEGPWANSSSVKASKRRDVSLISIERTEFQPVFTAAFKTYATLPIGTVVIRNNDEIRFRNVKISVSLKKYGDFATETVVSEIGAGEERAVPVTLTLNDQVLELTENTPVQADVRVAYYEDNMEKSVSQNAPLTLYSRNAISWSNKARIASFITPRDVPVVEYSRAAIREFLAPLKASAIKPLAKALLLYESMNALGISYVPDPNTPFSKAAEHPETMDYVQFPRETLRRKTGDCDDTTALLSSLLESIGVQTALVDTPGHIFMMANLEETDAEQLGLPTERFVEFEGTYWVPIETTRLGKDFLTSWQTAISQVRAGQEKGKIEFVRASKAMESFAPVTLVEKDTGVNYPSEVVKGPFTTQLAKLHKERYEGQLTRIRESIKKDPDNKFLQIQMGMIHVEGGNTVEGKKIFESLLDPKEEVPVRASAENNLGNLAFLDGKFEDAAKRYATASELTPDDGGVWVNRARTAWKQGKNAEAKSFLADAKKHLPGWREYAADLPAELLPPQ